MPVPTNGFKLAIPVQPRVRRPRMLGALVEIRVAVKQNDVLTRGQLWPPIKRPL
jgi:hypothetical protein